MTRRFDDVIGLALGGFGLFLVYNLSRQGSFGDGIQDSAYDLCKALSGEKQCNAAFPLAAVNRARARAKLRPLTGTPSQTGGSPPASGSNSGGSTPGSGTQYGPPYPYANIYDLAAGDPNICEHMRAWRAATGGSTDWQAFRAHETAITYGFDPGDFPPREFLNGC